MAGRHDVTVHQQGRRYRLGVTPEYGGIWRKRLWGGRLIYPLTDEGWQVATAQFAVWESPEPLMDTTTTASQVSYSSLAVASTSVVVCSHCRPRLPPAPPGPLRHCPPSERVT